MRELILRMFFQGDATAEELNADLEGAFRQRSRDSRELMVEPMVVEFDVEPRHLVALCDAVAGGSLRPENLEAVGFALMGSDHFNWDADTELGGRVAQVLDHWATPEINYTLNVANVRKWRGYLVDGKDTFTRADLWGASGTDR